MGVKLRPLNKKMDIKKIIQKGRSIIITPFRLFFFHTNKIPVFRRIGLLIYKAGLKISVAVFKSMPEIEAIYSKTKIEKDSFIVGESDIDLLIIMKNMPPEKEMRFLRKFYFRYLFLITVFPFIPPAPNFFKDEFVSYQRLSKAKIKQAKIYPKKWRLLYFNGKAVEQPDNVIEFSNKSIRGFYENILLITYESEINNEKRFRRLYKFVTDIAKSIFIQNEKKVPKNIQEYKEFLMKKGASKRFVEDFFKLPERNYKCDKEFLSLALYHTMRLIETSGNMLKNEPDLKITYGKSCKEPAESDDVENFVNKLDKNNIQSIYLSKIMFKENAYYLYIILNNDIKFQGFRKTFNSVLKHINLLTHFKKQIKLKIKDMCAQEFLVYPIIATERMMKNSNFADMSYPYESVVLKENSKKLFGKKIGISLDSEHIKNTFANSVSLMMFGNIKRIVMSRILRPKTKSEEAIKKLMAYRLLKEKNIICLSNIQEQYNEAFNELRLGSEHPYLFARKILNSAIRQGSENEDSNSL